MIAGSSILILISYPYGQEELAVCEDIDQWSYNDMGQLEKLAA
ncbi:hypothetical protein CASFOL_030943 [Castilleja foliolosa]|uniref:Uncharacterized protein n=1 Tax=Castilleja foliolosa TaxID=1961234 RepID=A0ABD3C7T9_9LAMI